MSYQYPCEYLSNYDGDTVKVRIDLGFKMYHDITVRIAGIDTAELRGGSKELKAYARIARDVVKAWCEKHAPLTYSSHSWNGKYGRSLGDLFYVDENDTPQYLTEYLLKHYLAEEYQGGSRKEINQRHERNMELFYAKSYDAVYDELEF